MPTALRINPFEHRPHENSGDGISQQQVLQESQIKLVLQANVTESMKPSHSSRCRDPLCSSRKVLQGRCTGSAAVSMVRRRKAAVESRPSVCAHLIAHVESLLSAARVFAGALKLHYQRWHIHKAVVVRLQ